MSAEFTAGRQAARRQAAQPDHLTVRKFDPHEARHHQANLEHQRYEAAASRLRKIQAQMAPHVPAQLAPAPPSSAGQQLVQQHTSVAGAPAQAGAAAVGRTGNAAAVAAAAAAGAAASTIPLKARTACEVIVIDDD